jgi:peroxiredoxin
MMKSLPRVLIATLILLWMTLPISPSRAAWLNDKAPDFTLTDMTGKPVSLGRLRGRVVFINFWASWCPPCKKETPQLNELAERYKTSDLTVLAVNIDKTRGKAEEFLERIGLLHSNRLTILLDPQSTVVSSYGARAMPTSFLIDREGTIRYVHLGFNESDSAIWIKEVESLFKPELPSP